MNIKGAKIKQNLFIETAIPEGRLIRELGSTAGLIIDGTGKITGLEFDEPWTLRLPWENGDKSMLNGKVPQE